MVSISGLKKKTLVTETSIPIRLIPEPVNHHQLSQSKITGLGLMEKLVKKKPLVLQELLRKLAHLF